MTQQVCIEDAIFDTVVSGVQRFIGARLKESVEQSESSYVQQPIIISATTDCRQSSETHISSLSAIRLEIEVMRKLEIYYREKVAQLTRKEERQKIRIRYQYSLLPRLPIEIIMQILSLLDPLAGNTVNTGIRNGISVEAHGLLPYLILNPHLTLPPYCKYFDTSMTLENFYYHEFEKPILTDALVASSVRLGVTIYDWEILRNAENLNILRSLLQTAHQWKRLRLKFRDAEQIFPFLNALAPSLPHIECLIAYEASPRSAAPFSLASIKSDATSLSTRSLRIANLSFCILSVLFDAGFLDTITHLNLLDTISPKSESITRLVHILSGLSCLKTLTIEPQIRLHDERNSSLRVRSSSLNVLNLNLRSAHSHCLALLSDCQIDTINVSVDSMNLLNHLAQIFPGVKELNCVSSLLFGFILK